MEIKKITIVNWEKIEYEKINFENLMIFIGEANKGKSSVIKAISAIGNDEIKNENFREKDKKIEIKIKFFTSEKGFLTLKIQKEYDREIEYIIIDHGREIKISKDEKNEIFQRMNTIIFKTKNDSLKSSLEELGKLLKDSKIGSIVIRKFEFLSKQYVSQGVQRRVLMDFFKEILNEVTKREDEKIKKIIFVLEEPELHLNPQECREFYDILIKISNLGIKILLKTYSSYFVGLKQYKSICMMRKVNSKIKILQYMGRFFNGDEIKNFNMNYWINPDRGEMFFAKKVILVEGQTDKIVISALSKKLGIYRYNYSIIECGSKSIIPQFIKVLNAFKIPYVAVFDKDNHIWRNEIELENSNRKNREIERIVKKDLGKSIAFENDIEEEIYSAKRDRKNYKNKPYYALQTILDKSYVMPKRLKEKIESIYD